MMLWLLLTVAAIYDITTMFQDHARPSPHNVTVVRECTQLYRLQLISQGDSSLVLTTQS